MENLLVSLAMLAFFTFGGVVYGQTRAKAEIDKALGEARQARYDLEDERAKHRN